MGGTQKQCIHRQKISLRDDVALKQQRDAGERSYELLGVRKVVVARSKEWGFVIVLMIRLNLDSGEVDINYWIRCCIEMRCPL